MSAALSTFTLLCSHRHPLWSPHGAEPALEGRTLCAHCQLGESQFPAPNPGHTCTLQPVLRASGRNVPGHGGQPGSVQMLQFRPARGAVPGALLPPRTCPWGRGLAPHPEREGLPLELPSEGSWQWRPDEVDSLGCSLP